MIQKTASVIAVIFGVLTLVASSRILYLGSDPGYVVFMPLLIFNHIMGGVLFNSRVFYLERQSKE